MGSKTGSRELMRKAGVPVVPGTGKPAAGAPELAEFARGAGYPILLKASAGGGVAGGGSADAVPRGPGSRAATHASGTRAPGCRLRRLRPFCRSMVLLPGRSSGRAADVLEHGAGPSAGQRSCGSRSSMR